MRQTIPFGNDQKKASSVGIALLMATMNAQIVSPTATVYAAAATAENRIPSVSGRSEVLAPWWVNLPNTPRL
jgi:hypothetical protein